MGGNVGLGSDSAQLHFATIKKKRVREVILLLTNQIQTFREKVVILNTTRPR